MILRRAMMLSVVLFNAETWHRLTKENIKKLESIDLMLLRKLFKTPTSTPKTALYLETGCVPIRYVIKGKRIMYLHHILTREDALIKQVFRAQEAYQGKGDWYQVVREDLDALGLVNISFDEISLKSKESLRKLINERINEVALKYLKEESQSLSKVGNMSYSKLEMQSYLTGNMPNRLKQLAFRWRTKMIQVGWNYGKKESCPICLQANDTQNHLIECTFLNDKNTATNYDIEKNNNYNLTQHMIRLEAAIRKREIILEERQKQTDTVSPHVN